MPASADSYSFEKQLVACYWALQLITDPRDTYHNLLVV